MEAHSTFGSNSPFRVRLVRDEGLARLIGNGSERAFAALYHRYHQQLYRYCRSMLRDDADAQDALQSTFASAFAALRDGRRDAPMRPWLFRIAHNESISIIRRRRPQSELPEGLPAPSAATEEQAEQHERLQRLVSDLRELPERQRAALLMRELSGLSHEDIALALQTTVGAAKQTIFEARRTLAEFEAGRMASCAEICRTVSNGDRRALRGRKVRAHLRGCAACAAFASSIPARSADLRALTPTLPPALTGLLLSRALGAGTPQAGAGGGGAVGAGAAGKATVVLSGAKVATTIAVAATATFGVAAAFRARHVVIGAPARPAATTVAPRHVVSAGAARVAPGLTRNLAHEVAESAPARTAGVHRRGGASATVTRASRVRHPAGVTTTSKPVARASRPEHGRGGAYAPPPQASDGRSHNQGQGQARGYGRGQGGGQGHGNGGRSQSGNHGRGHAYGHSSSPPGQGGSTLPGKTSAPGLMGVVVHTHGNPNAPGLTGVKSHGKGPDLPPPAA